MRCRRSPRGKRFSRTLMPAFQPEGMIVYSRGLGRRPTPGLRRRAEVSSRRDGPRVLVARIGDRSPKLRITPSAWGNCPRVVRGCGFAATPGYRGSRLRRGYVARAFHPEGMVVYSRGLGRRPTPGLRKRARVPSRRDGPRVLVARIGDRSPKFRTTPLAWGNCPRVVRGCGFAATPGYRGSRLRRWRAARAFHPEGMVVYSRRPRRRPTPGTRGRMGITQRVHDASVK